MRREPGRGDSHAQPFAVRASIRGVGASWTESRNEPRSRRLPARSLLARSRLAQSLLALALLVGGGCTGNALPPSVWPPPDFELLVDEFEQQGASMHVVRRLRVDATGLVFYGTSGEPLVDEVTGTSLPVFSRLCLYQLERTSLRALARRLDRLGIAELSGEAASLAGSGDVGLAVRWRAFGEHRVLTCQGRARGPMVEILAEIAAHLPPGESFETRLSRPIVPVLRGVPEPARSVDGAYEACAGLLAERARLGVDAGDLLLRETFALACASGRRAQALELLERWRQEQASRSVTFSDDPRGPALDASLLMRLVPSEPGAVGAGGV